jgi:hypothetical protein
VSESIWTDADLIYSYTRAQAIEDGDLVDVTEWASAEKGFMGGFTIPVALTRALWAAIEAIPPSLEGIADVRGRAHDVLWMASLAARRGGSDIYFKVILPQRGTRKRNVILRGNCGPGDDGEPVITLGFPQDF